MAVKLIRPWLSFGPGAVIDRGAETDAKLIDRGIAEAVEKRDDPAKGPKGKKHGNA